MAEIDNLRRARKAKLRAGKEKTAAENRARFGRTKAEKVSIRAEDQHAARHLDQHKRDRDD